MSRNLPAQYFLEIFWALREWCFKALLFPKPMIVKTVFRRERFPRFLKYHMGHQLSVSTKILMAKNKRRIQVEKGLGVRLDLNLC
jgi:hypothetical protein